MFLFTACLSVLLLVVQGDKCPAKYLRYSPDHTFCKGTNPQCQIVKSGVSEEDRKVILDVHNQFRSQVASGRETQAGGLPQGANMLQMEWDDELATIAQKHASQCIFEHDCNECRAVDNFSVGQNLYSSSSSTPEWKNAITAFYNEVKDFDKRYVSNFVFQGKYGHFSQVVWARSWKIGCGFVLYKEGNNNKGLYTCNYGEAGNLGGVPMYVSGGSCSQCPDNTCCSSSCNLGGPTYDGLCKIKDATKGPRENKRKDGYFCDWSANNQYCLVETTGNWHKQQTLSGDYQTVTLEGGQKATLRMEKAFKPKGSDFCLKIHYRRGNQFAGKKDTSSLKASLKYQGGSDPIDMNLGTSGTSFTTMSITLSWPMETAVTFVFSVPNNDQPHILDIKEVEFYDGKCGSRT